MGAGVSKGPRAMRALDRSFDGVVLISGGIDSMVAAHLMCEQGLEVAALFVDYGHPAANPDVS